MAEGKLQIEGEVIHVIVKRCFDLTKLLRGLTGSNDVNLPLLTLSRADEKAPVTTTSSENRKLLARQNTEKKVFPEGRNFK